MNNAPIKELAVLPVEIIIVPPEPPNILCFCITYVRTLGIPVPHGTNADELLPNTAPRANVIVLYNYGGKAHGGKILSVEETGYWEQGTNLEPCKPYTRFVKWGHPNLVGFYSPPTSLATN